MVVSLLTEGMLDEFAMIRGSVAALSAGVGKSQCCLKPQEQWSWKAQQANESSGKHLLYYISDKYSVPVSVQLEKVIKNQKI